MAEINRDHAPDHLDDIVLKYSEDGDKKSWAMYSADMKYRYRLRRYWGDGKRLAFLMLNPSTATELKNDPTVERCERRARVLGYGGFEVVNIFALRSTDPKGLYASDDPIGLHNDECIKAAIIACDDALCAWGNHGMHLGRGESVKQDILRYEIQLLQLGITKMNQPKHPLYVSYSIEPSPWIL